MCGEKNGDKTKLVGDITRHPHDVFIDIWGEPGGTYRQEDKIPAADSNNDARYRGPQIKKGVTRWRG
jgi:hypothetical protein